MYYDYHWYRQDSDGLWSHKPGQLAVTRYDATGTNLIIDPQTADRNNLNSGGAYYYYFCGYYCVTPWNNLAESSRYNANLCDANISSISYVEK